MTSRKVIGQTLSVALSILLLWFSFRGVDWHAFKASLSSCRWWYLAASALMGLLMPMCRSLRWRHTVLPFAHDLTRREAITANYAAYLLNMAIPMTHEAARCVIVHNSPGGKDAPYDKLVGVAVTERACDAICILILCIAAALLSWDEYGMFVLSETGGSRLLRPLLVLAMVICAIIALDIISHRRGGHGRVMGSIRSFFSGMHEGLLTVFRMKDPLLFIIETILLWAIYWMQLYLGVLAVPSLDMIGAADVLFLTLCGTLSTIIPVPGGFGAFHYVIATALTSICAASWTDGISFATLVHESQSIALMLMGAVSISLLPPSIRKGSSS